VDLAAAREALGGLGLSTRRLEPILGGWAYYTFALEPGWIFRFPRMKEAVRDLECEIRLLPLVEGRVRFAVPRFESIGEFRGRPFVGYRRIPGRPLERDDLVGPGSEDLLGDLASALRELHAIPVEAAREVLRVEGTREEWIEGYAGLRRAFLDRVGPSLDTAARSAVERGFDRFAEREAKPFHRPALVHRDLGPEHVLVDPESRRLAGIIDFGDAAVGDTAIDLVGIRLGCGEAPMRAVLERYGGARDEGFEARLLFYSWVCSINEILYGLGERDDALVAKGHRELNARLGEAGLLA
jgi:aminoglycoside 2''-phosphotransferase